MTERDQADVVVIGGGPCGVAAAAAARAASGGSATVVLVDDDPSGPRPVAGRPVAALLRDAASAGADWAAARAAATKAVRDAAAPDAAVLAGVTVLTGRASLTAKGAVEVEPVDATGSPLRITARRVVLATGSAPALPDVTGLTDTRHVTTDTLLAVADLPGSVAVVGAGRRGTALAQALARLGVTVTLVEARDRVLPRFDPDASAVVESALRKDGVRLLLGSPVVTVAPTLDDGAWVGTELGSDVAAELLVVASGRRPDLAGLDLPSARVTVGKAGEVTVDDRLRTSNRDVLAAGPVTGRRHDLPMARLAGANAVARLRPARWTPEPLVVSVPTQPAVAAVGVSEAEAVDRPGTAIHELLGPAGLVRVVVTTGRDPRILGATVVTTGAADAAAATVLAISAGLAPHRLADLAEPGSALAALASALARPSRRPGTPARPHGDDAVPSQRQPGDQSVDVRSAG